jgi:hypothetical protein
MLLICLKEMPIWYGIWYRKEDKFTFAGINIDVSIKKNNYLKNKTCNVYFWRDAKAMARDVNEILINLCKTEGNMTTADATQYIKDLGQKTVRCVVW